MPKAFVPQIATGNHLLEGDVVYFTAAGGWTRELSGAAVAMTKDDAQALLGRASAFPNEIVGVYLANVTVDGGGLPQPAHFREAFRLKGPSNRPEHGRASGHAAAL
ncbi:MAG: DUF2849 domain-containing protein [Pseudomonadota bacterium]